MRSHARALVALSLLAFAGCASKPPPVTYYLLRADPVEGTSSVSGEPERAGIGRIVVAPYLLDSQGLMLETAPGEVVPANQHRWAEPLDSGLLWYMRSEIRSALGSEIGGGLADRQSWDYLIELAISRMHGTMGGRALLEAQFVITPVDRRRLPVQGRFSKSTALTAEGHVALVAAQRTLLSEFAGQIALSLRTLLDDASMDR